MADATVAKLDIEGTEFDVFPEQMDEMPLVHSWIVEIHPSSGKDPEAIIQAFRKRDFDILWVNREKNIVEPYVDGSSWTSHTTIFAVKDSSALGANAESN